MAVDLQTAYQAINALYNGASAENNAAQEWLGHFQQTMDAWTICDQILQERRENVACCFAAQTLRQKILKNLKELPAESYESLRESLINHICSIEVNSNDHTLDATTTQLCLSIADLYIQVPHWNNWIAELLNKCSTALQGDRTRMMLTLLRVFPEEIHTVKVGENRRRMIQEELAASGTSVMLYLDHVLQAHHSDADMLKKVFQCLSAYLTNPSLSTDPLANSPLLQSAFAIVANTNVDGSLHDAATESIVSALIRAEDQGAHMALAVVLQQWVYNLAEPFNQAVVKEEMDKLQNFARIFVEVVETLLDPIINTASQEIHDLGCLHSLDLLLLLAGHHDYSLVEMTFNIWYRLTEGLFQIEDDSHVAKFKPYAIRYVSALYRHARYDTEEEGIPDATNEFADFRSKVIETLRDVVFIVGTETCLRNLFELLSACARSNGTWDETESALFLISVIIPNLIPEEDSVVPELLQAIINLPMEQHPALLLTSVELLGSCADWLQTHASFHDQVLHWLLRVATDVRFTAKACLATELITLKSIPTLMYLLPSFSQLIAHLEQTTTNGAEVEKAIGCLLRASTCLILQLPNESIKQKIGELCVPIVNGLNQIMNTDPSTLAASNKENQTDSWARQAARPTTWLDRMGDIFKQIPPWASSAGNQAVNGDIPPAPWLDVANALYEILFAVITRFESDTRVAEHVCRSLRYLIRSLGTQSIGLVEPLVTKMIDIYSRHPHSCFLYLASILVDEYGTIESIRPGMLQMLVTLANGTFATFAKPNGFRDNPDTVDDLFRLTARFVHRAPSTFFLDPISSTLFDCGMVALSLDHSEANKSVAKFFNEIFDQLMSARKVKFYDAGVAAAQQLIQDKGAKLIYHALNAAVFELSGGQRRDMADIIYNMGKYNKEKQLEYVTYAVSQLKSVRTVLGPTPDQQKQFITNVTETTTNGARHIHNQIRDLIQLFE